MGCIYKKITEVNYKGPTALEIMHMGYEHIKDPSEFLAIAFERARRLEELRYL